MRVFAGPNGSGKSTIFDQINEDYDVGFYLNPDRIGKQIDKFNSLELSEFGLENIEPKKFSNFVNNHSLIPKAKKEGYNISLRIKDNRITNPPHSTYSYEASLITDFLRQELIQHGKKFTFETVMSHLSKIEVMDYAIRHGYKNYLYFICTSSPKINMDRVKLRVKQGGHYVPEKKIEQRYYRTLSLLKQAVGKTYRTFIWDNSGKTPKLILEVFEGKVVTFYADKIPFWVNKYLLNA